METFKTELKQYAQSLGITVGICGARLPAEAAAQLDAAETAYGRPAFVSHPPQARGDASLLLPGAQSVVCCLLPYGGNIMANGNLARYARIPDYHTEARNLLNELASWIASNMPEAQCFIQVDNGPLAERAFAYQAGLGFFGRNHCLIHPVYGSFCFLALLVTTLPLPPDAPLHRTCGNCGRCVSACPGGALTADGSFRQERCVSLLTQLTEVTAEQRAILARQPMVFGCDACQSVCPHNQGIPAVQIAPFREPQLCSLDVSEVCAMSNRQFRRTYGQYPFAWRGNRVFRKYLPDEE